MVFLHVLLHEAHLIDGLTGPFWAKSHLINLYVLNSTFNKYTLNGLTMDKWVNGWIQCKWCDSFTWYMVLAFFLTTNLLKLVCPNYPESSNTSWRSFHFNCSLKRPLGPICLWEKWQVCLTHYHYQFLHCHMWLCWKLSVLVTGLSHTTEMTLFRMYNA